MRLSAGSFISLLVALVACSTGPDPEASGTSEPRAVGRKSSAVINGAVDSAHPAVVALILAKGSQGGLCSGTIVKVDAQRHIGWVATAAHCVEVPPSIVVQAQNFLEPDAIRYTVLDYEADDRYGGTGSNYDFAMVRIAGVDADTPVIPLTTSPDGIANGSQVTSVGFGRTSLAEPTSPDDENTERRFVQKTLDDVSSALIGYDMSTKGICQGDSGGPVIAGSGSTQRVVGIHSFVQGDCDGRGYSGRVTSGLQFFNQQLAKPLPAETCSLCKKIANSGKSECATMSASCLADKDCKGYYECLSEKKEAECFEEYPLAEGPFYAAANCVCTRACADVCGASECGYIPKCGFDNEKGDCSTCIEASCCQEETDCAADGLCYVCLKNDDADPKCASNAARKKLANCAASKCKTQCADSPIQAGGEEEASAEEEAAPAKGSTPSTTITKSSCSTSGGPSSGAGFVLLAGALCIACARRRRHD